MHGFIDKLLGNGKLEDGEVNERTCALVFVETHVMVCFGGHCTRPVSFYDADFDMHGFISFRRNLELGLLNHNLEEALHPRSELNYVVSIVVHRENIGDVEISRHKLLVVLDLI